MYSSFPCNPPYFFLLLRLKSGWQNNEQLLLVLQCLNCLPLSVTRFEILIIFYRHCLPTFKSREQQILRILRAYIPCYITRDIHHIDGVINWCQVHWELLSKESIKFTLNRSHDHITSSLACGWLICECQGKLIKYFCI